MVDDTVQNILTSSKIDAWESYISKFNKKYPNDQVYMVDMLAARYGDDVLSQLIEAAKNVKGSKELAEKLRTDQFRGWFNREDNSVAAVIKTLKLDDPNNWANPNWNVVAKYLELFNNRARNDKTKLTTLVDSFKTAYGGKRRLALTLSLLPESNAQVKELQNALFTQWADKQITKKYVVTVMFKGNMNNWFGEPFATVVIRYGNFLHNRKFPNPAQ